ncbi:hypothetical protein V8E55_003183, partial [Tylopilus felleus]
MFRLSSVNKNHSNHLCTLAIWRVFLSLSSLSGGTSSSDPPHNAGFPCALSRLTYSASKALPTSNDPMRSWR